MVNYMASAEAHEKHDKKHLRSARFKKIKAFFKR
jgi:hypothetical protein